MKIIKGFNKKLVSFLPIFITIAIFLTALITVYYISLDQQYDGIRINISGRQRMLTQKITKDILYYSLGKISKDKIERNIMIFDTTLFALTFGGPVYIDLNTEKTEEISGMKNIDIKDQLITVNKLWQPFKQNITDYMDSNSERAFAYIYNNNEYLLSEVNKSVNMMQQTAENNNFIINFIIYSIVGLSFLWITIRFKQKAGELRKVSKRIKNLENLLPICSNCKKIRLEDKDPYDMQSWVTVESYFKNKDKVEFSHGICPDCAQKLYPGLKYHAGDE